MTITLYEELVTSVAPAYVTVLLAMLFVLDGKRTRYGGAR